jgi:hypothetical protein
MTKDRVAKLAEAFAAEYRDPDIDVRLFFDWWTDRLRLRASLADRLWTAVTAVLGENRPGLSSRKRTAYRLRGARPSPLAPLQPATPP